MIFMAYYEAYLFIPCCRVHKVIVTFSFGHFFFICRSAIAFLMRLLWIQRASAKTKRMTLLRNQTRAIHFQLEKVN